MIELRRYIRWLTSRPALKSLTLFPVTQDISDVLDVGPAAVVPKLVEFQYGSRPSGDLFFLEHFVAYLGRIAGAPQQMFSCVKQPLVMQSFPPIGSVKTLILNGLDSTILEEMKAKGVVLQQLETVVVKRYDEQSVDVFSSLLPVAPNLKTIEMHFVWFRHPNWITSANYYRIPLAICSFRSLLRFRHLETLNCPNVGMHVVHPSCRANIQPEEWLRGELTVVYPVDTRDATTVYPVVTRDSDRGRAAGTHLYDALIGYNVRRVVHPSGNVQRFSDSTCSIETQASLMFQNTWYLNDTLIRFDEGKCRD